MQGTFGLSDLRNSKLISRWDNGFDELRELKCYPLYTYLLAVERTKVDFLVININGQELDVLKTLPWDEVTIYVCNQTSEVLSKDTIIYFSS